MLFPSPRPSPIWRLEVGGRMIGKILKSLPPHPNPLPRGEREYLVSLYSPEEVVFFALPSPGEGVFVIIFALESNYINPLPVIFFICRGAALLRPWFFDLPYIFYVRRCRGAALLRPCFNRFVHRGRCTRRPYNLGCNHQHIYCCIYVCSAGSAALNPYI